MTNAQIETAVLQRQCARLVEREVLCCMSSLVATLANAYGDGLPRRNDNGIALDDLACQADELAYPVLDYEGAARDAGAKIDARDSDGRWIVLDQPEDSDMWSTTYDDEHNAAVAFCDFHGIEPHELEVYEHWAVSSWLAEKLIAKGDRVDTDFAGLNVWARTTTGQAISIDGVIEAIVRETGYAIGVN